MDIICGFLRDYAPSKGADTVLESHLANCGDCQLEAGLQ